MTDKSDDGVDELLQARKKEALSANDDGCICDDVPDCKCRRCVQMEPPCCPACDVDYNG